VSQKVEEIKQRLVEFR